MQKELEEFLYEEAKNQIPPIIRQTEELFEDKEFCEKYNISNESCLTNENLENAKPINFKSLEEDVRNMVNKQIKIFSEIKKIEKEYKDFLKQLRKRKVKIKKNAFSVICFLYYKDYLKVDNKEDSKVNNG